MNNPPVEDAEKAPAKNAADKAEKPASKKQEGPVLDFFDAITEVNGTRA